MPRVSGQTNSLSDALESELRTARAKLREIAQREPTEYHQLLIRGWKYYITNLERKLKGENNDHRTRTNLPR
jgi:hypothetical protein